MSFHVGQKVVCVRASGGRLPVLPLKKGAVYTIRDAGPEQHINGYWVILEEIFNCGNRFHDELGYAANRFRPIVSRKTDIAIFKRMLLPQGVDA